jgi:hypothetical protein
VNSHIAEARSRSSISVADRRLGILPQVEQALTIAAPVGAKGDHVACLEKAVGRPPSSRVVFGFNLTHTPPAAPRTVEGRPQVTPPPPQAAGLTM